MLMTICVYVSRWEVCHFMLMAVCCVSVCKWDVCHFMLMAVCESVSRWDVPSVILFCWLFVSLDRDVLPVTLCCWLFVSLSPGEMYSLSLYAVGCLWVCLQVRCTISHFMLLAVCGYLWSEMYSLSLYAVGCLCLSLEWDVLPVTLCCWLFASISRVRCTPCHIMLLAVCVCVQVIWYCLLCHLMLVVVCVWSPGGLLVQQGQVPLPAPVLHLLSLVFALLGASRQGGCGDTWPDVWHLWGQPHQVLHVRHPANRHRPQRNVRSPGDGRTEHRVQCYAGQCTGEPNLHPRPPLSLLPLLYHNVWCAAAALHGGGHETNAVAGMPPAGRVHPLWHTQQDEAHFGAPAAPLLTPDYLRTVHRHEPHHPHHWPQDHPLGSHQEHECQVIGSSSSWTTPLTGAMSSSSLTSRLSCGVTSRTWMSGDWVGIFMDNW